MSPGLHTAPDGDPLITNVDGPGSRSFRSRRFGMEDPIHHPERQLALR